MKKDRGFMSGQVWDGEYASQGEIDLANRIATLEAGAGDDTGTTYAGVPQPATPYVIAQRADPNGKIYSSVRFTSISANLKKFAFTHKMVRPDGTYGEAQRQIVHVTAAMIAADDCSIEIEHAFRANRTIHNVLIEGKFTTTVSDDGGNTDQNPPAATYQDEAFPGEFGQTPLATFTTGAGIVGPQVDNELYNTKCKYAADTYTKPNGTTVDAVGQPTALAMWRFPVVGAQIGGDNTRFLTTALGGQQHWDISTINYAPCIMFEGNTPDQDVCGRTQQKPWDAGEPFAVAAAFRLNGNFAGTDLLIGIEAYLEDSVAGRIATTQINGIGSKANRFTWENLQFDLTAVSSLYTPTPGSKQWVRFGLRGPAALSAAVSIAMYKPQAGNMPGAWKAHPNDRGQEGNPTAAPTSGGGRGNVGVGTTGNETPASSGGQIIRGNVN